MKAGDVVGISQRLQFNNKSFLEGDTCPVDHIGIGGEFEIDGLNSSPGIIQRHFREATANEREIFNQGAKNVNSITVEKRQNLKISDLKPIEWNHDVRGIGSILPERYPCPPPVPKGILSYDPLDLEVNESHYIRHMDYLKRSICNTFRIDPSMLGVAGITDEAKFDLIKKEDEPIIYKKLEEKSKLVQTKIDF